MPAISRSERGALVALLAFALVALALLPATASAARVPTFRVGSQVVIRITTRHPNAKRYGVFLTVAAKRKTDRYGSLKRTKIGTFAKMTAKGGGRFVWKSPAYTFPDWFMMRPGTYYWQTHVTDCNVRGCRANSKIRAFKVR